MRIAEDSEVLVRGYSVTQGYLDDPGATAAEIGVPGARMGPVGKALVVLKASESALTEAELITWSKERMAGSKVPRTVALVDVLPLNASGKVMKDQLR